MYKQWSFLEKKSKKNKKKKKGFGFLPVPILSLQERQALSCFAAFLTLPPFVFKNLSTQALLQNFSCKTHYKRKP